MRDYLYIYNDPVSQYIVASGIEFRNLSDRVGLDGGLILLSPSFEYFDDYAERDTNTWLNYVPRLGVPELAKEDIYSWGTFCWADYAGNDLPAILDHEVAQLTFFNHAHRPLEKIVIPSLSNRYLCDIHDDGWYLKLYYSSWEDILALVSDTYPQLDFDEVRRGVSAYWVAGNSVEREHITEDIDNILNRRITRRPNSRKGDR